MLPVWALLSAAAQLHMHAQVVFDLEMCPPQASQEMQAVQASSHASHQGQGPEQGSASNVLPAEAASVAALVAALNKGQVVAVPTDTLYGAPLYCPSVLLLRRCTRAGVHCLCSCHATMPAPPCGCLVRTASPPQPPKPFSYGVAWWALAAVTTWECS